MNKLFAFFLFTIFLIAKSDVNAQLSSFFETQGNKIVDPCGNDFVMKGVNYSLSDDWNFPGNLNTGRELSSQIILANPNTVRIQWYVDYGQPSRPALSLVGLDSVISRFAAADIVTVLEIHDFTHIHTDTTAFNTNVVAWWTSQPVLDLIEKHKSHIFVNVANEYGPAMYPAPNYTLNPNYNSQITTWVTHYKNVVNRLRNAGIEVPIIIDAPNYGMDYQTVINNATIFNDNDPLHRIIMSCHAYWNSTASEMTSIVNQLSALTLPVILGEIGNVDFACNAIQMNSVLDACQNKGLGWLAWTWNRDECSMRNMTANQPGVYNSPTDGQFSTLTTYGDVIVNNPSFGLANHSAKAQFSCALELEKIENGVLFYPNPVKDELVISVNYPFTNFECSIVDLNGKTRLISNNTRLNISELESGIYFLKVQIDGKSSVLKLVH